jgi:hypothetical protein
MRIRNDSSPQDRDKTMTLSSPLLDRQNIPPRHHRVLQTVPTRRRRSHSLTSTHHSRSPPRARNHQSSPIQRSGPSRHRDEHSPTQARHSRSPPHAHHHQSSPVQPSHRREPPRNSSSSYTLVTNRRRY